MPTPAPTPKPACEIPEIDVHTRLLEGHRRFVDEQIRFANTKLQDAQALEARAENEPDPVKKMQMLRTASVQLGVYHNLLLAALRLVDAWNRAYIEVVRTAEAFLDRNDLDCVRDFKEFLDGELERIDRRRSEILALQELAKDYLNRLGCPPAHEFPNGERFKFAKLHEDILSLTVPEIYLVTIFPPKDEFGRSEDEVYVKLGSKGRALERLQEAYLSCDAFYTTLHGPPIKRSCTYGQGEQQVQPPVMEFPGVFEDCVQKSVRNMCLFRNPDYNNFTQCMEQLTRIAVYFREHPRP